MTDSSLNDLLISFLANLLQLIQGLLAASLPEGLQLSKEQTQGSPTALRQAHCGTRSLIIAASGAWAKLLPSMEEEVPQAWHCGAPNNGEIKAHIRQKPTQALGYSAHHRLAA